jgi:predicted metal-dependent phosphoesterase TrpH
MENSFRIQFARPDLAQLIARYTVVDLHFHSLYSDGSDTVEDIAVRARKLGIGIAITDHNEIRGAVELDQYRDIFSIPGIEVTSAEGTHTLVYFSDIESLKRFYRSDIEPFMGVDTMSSTSLVMEEVIQRARRYKTLIILPHPYSGIYTGIQNPYFPDDRLQAIFHKIDGVEAINSENIKKWNLRSTVLGFNLNKSMTGGSDGHQLSQMGTTVTYAACRKNRKAFLQAIKHAKNRVIGKEGDIFQKVSSNSIKLRTSFRNYPDWVEKNLKYSYAVLNSRSKTIKDNFKRSLNGNGKERRH